MHLASRLTFSLSSTSRSLEFVPSRILESLPPLTMLYTWMSTNTTQMWNAILADWSSQQDPNIAVSVTQGRPSVQLSFPCFSVWIKHKIRKNMNSVQQQCEHHKSFHLSGHTFRLDKSGFISFLGLVQKAISELPFTSVSKMVLVQSLSYGN